MNYRIIFLLFLIVFPLSAFSQEKISVRGHVYNEQEEPVSDANVYLPYTGQGTTTNLQGYFHLQFSANPGDTLVVSCIGYQSKKFEISEITTKENMKVHLESSVEQIGEVEVKSLFQKDRSLIKIEKKHFELLPTTTGEVESIIKKMPGVSSRNELSYQYSVRGGNFDENLVYVNGIEIYRPIIVRSGKQEGLSFINSDMVSSINFSAGGFEARYGDKLSSVLDIQYKKPKKFSGDAELSLLGGSLHLQDVFNNGKFTYNVGFRYKSTQYLLNTLDVEGDYKPTFYDLQSFFTYDASEKLKFEFLGNYNLNNYTFIPQTRSTSFGTLTNALNLNIYYEGQERDRFENYLGALSAKYYPSSSTTLKFIASSFNTIEEETYDILGEYYLNELDNSMNSETYGDSLMNLGTGGFLEHARNYLRGTVHSFSHKGSWDQGLNLLKWGVKYKHEIIHDETDEWKMVDSAGYSIPYSDQNVDLYHTLKADNSVHSNRFSGYLQNTYELPTINSDWYINAGIRASYWDFSDIFVFSPRMLISYEPNWQNNLGFHVSVGSYAQPPFYKEMKRPDGSLNRDIKAQKSVHFVFGSEYDFILWKRPFKFTTEVYYKKLNDLIPYKINNVRVRYSGENMAHGYATGLDMKINGEFVEGVESWASLSIMETKENIKGDFYYNQEGEKVTPGYYPRPTDQLINFNLFFQDYVPSFPTYKVHISLHYGSKLPFTPPDTKRYDQVFYMPPYRRIDLGFSKSIKRKEKEYPESSPLHYINSFWIGLDVFNALDIDNTISYQWIKTVGNQTGQASQYAVPNYLTSRRFNLKLIVKF
jgi:hypothetical protein